MILSPDSPTLSAERITESLLDRVFDLALDINAELNHMRQQGVAQSELKSKHQQLEKLVALMITTSEEEQA